MRLKRWSRIAAVTLLAAWIVVLAARDLFSHETIGYYSTQPLRLLYVAAVAVAIGLTVLAYNRLSPRTRRHIRIFTWGAGASTLSISIGYMVYMVISIFSLTTSPLTHAGTGGGLLVTSIEYGVHWMLLLPLYLSCVAAYLWFEFYRALKLKPGVDEVRQA